MNNRSSYLSIVLAIISFVVIFILKFTDIRIVCCENADNYNEVALTLSYSFVAAMIFYLANDYLPRLPLKKVSRNHINRSLKEVHENMRQIVGSIRPFVLDNKGYTEDSFCRAFEEVDLNDKFMGGEKPLIDYINLRKDRIIALCESLLSSYSDFMKASELRYVDRIMKSYFVNNLLVPINHDVPEEYRVGYPNNQAKIGKSIYQLYKK